MTQLLILGKRKPHWQMPEIGQQDGLLMVRFMLEGLESLVQMVREIQS